MDLFEGQECTGMQVDKHVFARFFFLKIQMGVGGASPPKFIEISSVQHITH
jgi:hypothetical protein